MKKIVGVILIICSISLCLVATTYSRETNLDEFTMQTKLLSSDILSERLVRFHVIANSDTDVDQNIKLIVKDAVLQGMIPKLNISKSKDESINIIDENKEYIKDIAEKTLRRYNMSNNVSVVLDKTFFPTKYYNDFSLPAGEYLALRIIIGEGEGKNWWCVLFPPLCLVDVIKEEDMVMEKTTTELDNQSELYLEKLDDNSEQTGDIFEEERPQIRWKALEMFGFYDEQNQ
ncbi:stage II sporulation protein R [Alkalibaculum sp. M08DMB]|uniref:Stage II sporulation protein R n=1 Tax=Alkalibaculum sporogenes TaxID=2655001 RepID=A0A6A7K6H8_9FIRM|nr:stage II sporulation protein R [Alkalibaculum sporogenes]MPW25048.1 stage II sporulation protein R [Alkalibaculum sporogenes]